MRREIGYDVFASDDPHEQAMPFPNMGNNPLIPILGSCRNWHQSGFPSGARQGTPSPRSEEHMSALQSLLRISYAVFCLKKKMTLTQLPSHEDGRTAHNIHST